MRRETESGRGGTPPLPDRTPDRTQLHREQQTAEAACRPLDSADVLVMRQHYRDIGAVCRRADRYIVRLAERLDAGSQPTGPTDDAFTREQLRGFVRNLRVLCNVLDARIGVADTEGE